MITKSVYLKDKNNFYLQLTALTKNILTKDSLVNMLVHSEYESECNNKNNLVLDCVDAVSDRRTLFQLRVKKEFKVRRHDQDIRMHYFIELTDLQENTKNLAEVKLEYENNIPILFSWLYEYFAVMINK